MRQIAKKRGTGARLRVCGAARVLDDAGGGEHMQATACASKHRWESKGMSVRAGRWCWKCAHAIVGTIDGFRAYAVEQGGECLSEEYEGLRTMLRFRCRRRHRFELVASAVKSGVWCPSC